MLIVAEGEMHPKYSTWNTTTYAPPMFLLYFSLFDFLLLCPHKAYALPYLPLCDSPFILYLSPSGLQANKEPHTLEATDFYEKRTLLR